MSTPTPIEELRIGAVKAAVWQNRVDGNVRHNVTFGRLYRDEENGKWKTTRSFGRNDLLVLAKLADQVHTRIFELEAAEADNDRDA